MSLTPCQVCDCPVIDGEVCHECGERIPQAEVDEHWAPCAERHKEPDD